MSVFPDFKVGDRVFMGAHTVACRVIEPRKPLSSTYQWVHIEVTHSEEPEHVAGEKFEVWAGALEYAD